MEDLLEQIGKSVVFQDIYESLGHFRNSTPFPIKVIKNRDRNVVGSGSIVIERSYKTMQTIRRWSLLF
jgi:hypothetical protein